MDYMEKQKFEIHLFDLLSGFIPEPTSDPNPKKKDGRKKFLISEIFPRLEKYFKVIGFEVKIEIVDEDE